MYLDQKQILKALRLERFPPLEMSLGPANSSLSRKSKAKRESQSEVKTDTFMTIKWQNRSYQFVVELRGQSNPKTIESAVQQARRYAQQKPRTKKSVSRLYPMIVVPYLSDESIARLVEEEVSGLDLSGNGLIIVPNELFVLRSGAKNKFRDSEPIKNFYAGTSSIVARVFLMRPEFTSVSEVLDEILKRGGNVSMGTVSKVLKRLQDNLIVGRQQNIKLLQPEKLLERLQANYRSPKAARHLRGKVSAPIELAIKGTDLAKKGSLSFACRSPLPYVIFPGSGNVLSVYVSSSDELLKGSGFEETTRFPNIEIIETKDQLVYFDRREIDGVSYISPLQAYLELSSGGKREKETAEALRDDLISLKAN